MAGGEDALRRLAAASLTPEQLAARPGADAPEEPDPSDGVALAPAEWTAHVANAFQAILPLTFVLLFALWVIVRERLPQPDEVALGLAFSLIGILIFNYGMDRGLSSLGNQAGRALPRAWIATERPDKAVVYHNIDESLLVRAVQPDGSRAEYLPTASEDGPAFIPFLRDRYNAAAREYRWIPEDPPVAGGDAVWGYALVLFFVFAMGVGATLAEPSLNALGITLEELTTGTYKRAYLILTVALGVGSGMIAGFGRILFAWPLIPILVAAYAQALVLTALSSEGITAIAGTAAASPPDPSPCRSSSPRARHRPARRRRRGLRRRHHGLRLPHSRRPALRLVLAARRDDFERDNAEPDEPPPPLAELEARP